MTKFKRVQKLVKDNLKESKDAGALFTLVVDEWSTRRRRFIGVLLTCSTPIPILGGNSLELLTRFREKATSENLMTALEDVLATYGLDLGDIYGMTTDGASAMVKLGKLIAVRRGLRPFYRWKCLAHGLHLAVSAALKGNPVNVTDTPTCGRKTRGFRVHTTRVTH